MLALALARLSSYAVRPVFGLSRLILLVMAYLPTGLVVLAHESPATMPGLFFFRTLAQLLQVWLSIGMLFMRKPGIFPGANEPCLAVDCASAG
jgi:hypothetical protein